MSKVVRNEKNMVANRAVNSLFDLLKGLSEDLLKPRNPEAHEIAIGALNGTQRGVNNVMNRNNLALEQRKPIVTVSGGEDTIKQGAETEI